MLRGGLSASIWQKHQPSYVRSPQTKPGTMRSVCDPLVGVGLRHTVCEGLCDTWLAACRDDYFEWHREELVPCRFETLPWLLHSRRKAPATSTACTVLL